MNDGYSELFLVRMWTCDWAHDGKRVLFALESKERPSNPHWNTVRSLRTELYLGEAQGRGLREREKML